MVFKNSGYGGVEDGEETEGSAGAIRTIPECGSSEYVRCEKAEVVRVGEGC